MSLGLNYSSSLFTAFSNCLCSHFLPSNHMPFWVYLKIFVCWLSTLSIWTSFLHVSLSYLSHSQRVLRNLWRIPPSIFYSWLMILGCWGYRDWGFVLCSIRMLGWGTTIWDVRWVRSWRALVCWWGRTLVGSYSFGGWWYPWRSWLKEYFKG